MFKEIVQGMFMALGFIAAVFITILTAFLMWSFVADDGVESYSRAQVLPEMKMDFNRQDAKSTKL